MNTRSFLTLFSLAACATLLSGCISQAEQNAANRIITALPAEVEGCAFINDVDSYSSISMSGARFQLKLAAAKLNATHIVETFAVPTVITRSILGVSLSGRAYRCPQGKGPKMAAANAETQYDIPSAESVMGDANGPGYAPKLPRHSGQ